MSLKSFITINSIEVKAFITLATNKQANPFKNVIMIVSKTYSRLLRLVYSTIEDT